MKHDERPKLLRQGIITHGYRIFSCYYNRFGVCSNDSTCDICNEKNDGPPLVKRAGQIRESNKACDTPTQE